ncbi:Transmembrane 9 superfamily member 3 [Manis javanica]|nr:Transmembrane 9 superfamily member 3 [Manis javanica]
MSESQPLPPHQCQNKKPGTACQGAWRLFCLQLGGTNDSGCTRPTQVKLLSDSDSGLGGEGGFTPIHGALWPPSPHGMVSTTHLAVDNCGNICGSTTHIRTRNLAVP